MIRMKEGSEKFVTKARKGIYPSATTCHRMIRVQGHDSSVSRAHSLRDRNYEYMIG